MVINVPVNYLLPSIRSSKYITSIVSSFTHYIFNISDEISDSEEFSGNWAVILTIVVNGCWMTGTRSRKTVISKESASDWFKHLIGITVLRRWVE